MSRSSLPSQEHFLSVKTLALIFMTFLSTSGNLLALASSKGIPYLCSKALRHRAIRSGCLVRLDCLGVCDYAATVHNSAAFIVRMAGFHRSILDERTERKSPEVNYLLSHLKSLLSLFESLPLLFKSLLFHVESLMMLIENWSSLFRSLPSSLKCSQSIDEGIAIIVCYYIHTTIDRRPPPPPNVFSFIPLCSPISRSLEL